MFTSVHRGRSFNRERGVRGGRAARAAATLHAPSWGLSAGRGGAGEGFRLPGTLWMLSTADGAERSWLGAAVGFRKRSREQNVAPCGEGPRLRGGGGSRDPRTESLSSEGSGALAALQDPGQRAGRGRPRRVSDRGPALPPHPEPVAFVSLWPRRTGAVGEGQARPGRPVGPLGGLRDRNAHGVLPGATRCAPRCRRVGLGPHRGQAVRHPPRPPGLLPRAVPVLAMERVAEREHVTAGGWKCSSLGKDG